MFRRMLFASLAAGPLLAQTRSSPSPKAEPLNPRPPDTRMQLDLMRREISDQLRQEMRGQLKQDLKQELRAELRQELKMDLKQNSSPNSARS